MSAHMVFTFPISSLLLVAPSSDLLSGRLYHSGHVGGRNKGRGFLEFQNVLFYVVHLFCEGIFLLFFFILLGLDFIFDWRHSLV